MVLKQGELSPAQGLGQSPLFRSLSPAGITAVLEDPRCVHTGFSKGEAIFTPSSFTRSLGVLLSGSIQVSKEDLIVSILHAGDLFGAATLFNEEEAYVTTLTARENCALVLLPQVLVEELMTQYPTLAHAYIRYLSGRVRFLNDKIEGLIAGSAERKLAQYLLGQAEGNRVELDCSATGLAKRLNVSRASLYRAFDALNETGAAQKNGRTVEILDEKRLQTV